MKDLAASSSQTTENQNINPLDFDINLDKAISRSQDYLLSQQAEEGF